jgi:predicted ATP-grasp superfamily ATP-dependent carboligase
MTGKMINLLLTGGRAPFTLELARIFHRAGHTVFLAESLPGNLASTSRALAAGFIVPPPRQQPERYVHALQDIIRQCRIDLLIPTCEEAFYIARRKAELSANCIVFVESIEQLRPLHNKWMFVQLAAELGLSVPETILVETVDDLSAAFFRWPKLVLKPVYSRFAAHTLLLPSAQQAEAAFHAGRGIAWVAQEYLSGRQICTYSVVHQGNLTAHCAYTSDFTAGLGSMILFEAVNHPSVLAWVKKFVANRRFTGHIAFDFIENSSGEVFALECNPRATSGIHLFAETPDFTTAFLNPGQPCLFPFQSQPSMLLMAMLIYGLPQAFMRRKLKTWLTAFTSSRDVIFSLRDPAPAFFQLRNLLHLTRLGWRYKISPIEASTYDIEWNGE